MKISGAYSTTNIDEFPNRLKSSDILGYFSMYNLHHTNVFNYKQVIFR